MRKSREDELLLVEQVIKPSGIPVEIILGPTRRPLLTHWRKRVVQEFRDRHYYTLEEIGQVLRRSRSTIVWILAQGDLAGVAE